MAGNRHSKKLELRFEPMRCQHLYFYQIHPVLGWMFVRVQRIIRRIFLTRPNTLSPRCLRWSMHWRPCGVRGVWMRKSRRKQRHIVLLSRRDFPERSLWGHLTFENTYYEAVQSIPGAEKLGARITVAQGDVADESRMRSLFKRFGKEDPPLRGIVHAAVDMTSSSISDLNLEVRMPATGAPTEPWVEASRSTEIRRGLSGPVATLFLS